MPSGLWGISACKLLGQYRWQQLRLRICEEQKHRCAWCDVEMLKGIHCHEKWDYDQASGVATLSGFELHCPMCDFFCHIGFAGVKGYEKDARAHARRAFKYTAAQVSRVISQAFREWQALSKLSWRTAVGDEVLKRFPELIVVAGREGMGRDELARLSPPPDRRPKRKTMSPHRRNRGTKPPR